MNSTENIALYWQEASKTRASIYRWFAELFARELTPINLNLLESNNDYLRLFDQLELKLGVQRLERAILDLENIPSQQRALELAADFAQLFLLSGNESVPPYASYYSDENQQFYGSSDNKMHYFLDQQKLSLNPEFREPNDHLSIYLNIMYLFIIQQDNESLDNTQSQTSVQIQLDFLSQALINWLPKFNTRCQRVANQSQLASDLYPALSQLLIDYIQEDQMLMVELVEI